MKRVLILIVAVMLCAGAMAESTPDFFLWSQGIITFDADQFEDENGEIEQMIEQLLDTVDFSMCAYVYNVEDVGNVILWIKNGKITFAIDLKGLLADGTKYKKYSMTETFVELCYTYEFDVYAFGGNGQTFFLSKKEMVPKLLSITAGADFKPHFYTDYKKFFAELSEQTSGF